jgi:hypothetical protein
MSRVLPHETWRVKSCQSVFASLPLQLRFSVRAIWHTPVLPFLQLVLPKLGSLHWAGYTAETHSVRYVCLSEMVITSGAPFADFAARHVRRPQDISCGAGT